MSRRDSGGSERVRDEDVERQGRPKNDGIGSEQKTIIKLAIGQVNHPLMMKIISKTPRWFQYFHWDVAFLVVCVVAVAVDPLFFYLPVINEATKCITIDTTLEIIAICVRSVLDLVALGDLVARSRASSVDDCYSRSDYVINILGILPVPQILVPIIFSEMRGSKFRHGRKFLNAVVLLQYVPRLFRIYRLWKIVNQTIILPKSSTTSTSVKAVNAEIYKNMMMIQPKGFVVMKAGFNLFLYLVASHVLGAFWYFFSIERETTCWHVACKNDTGCSKTSFNCGGSSNNTSLNDYCSIEKKINTTLSFDYGIFKEARQSGILESKDFPRKTMFCFWWGLRNLRFVPDTYNHTCILFLKT
ncbi:cyclic nucleotide-gated ion channel 1-like [Juglans microcarpa x Juglans regia]|uniref:cyclic nucleotide-gated ion channel 1-like n=1 Tax=Juglans microcarpa x Juglans regia TaxID=2249226 RepID=UPI001B7DA0BD|nr:cyclic nucleotide-gated ion channel 1-like [Juglans microcarpa x Juglans regia]